MSTSVISNTVKGPTGTAIASVPVTVRLMPSAGFRSDTFTEVARVATTTTDSNGAWSLALERNSNIVPENSWYEVTEELPVSAGGRRVWLIQVGDSNQTLLASLVTPAASSPFAEAGYLTQESADARYAALDSIGDDTPSTIEPDDSADAGASTAASRGDHTHAIVAAAAGTIQPDDTAAEGTATSFARSDHRHAIAAAAPSSTGDANAEGSSTSFARADHVHKGVVAADAWTTWTPTVTQSSSVTFTTTRATYQRLGRTIIATCLLSLTSSGSSGNAIVLGGLPVAAASTNAILGFFRYFDSGNTIYAGTAFGASTTSVQFQVSGNGNPMGVNPTFGAASGDSLWATVIYEAAS